MDLGLTSRHRARVDRSHIPELIAEETAQLFFAKTQRRNCSARDTSAAVVVYVYKEASIALHTTLSLLM
jgi:hypothetical protein